MAKKLISKTGAPVVELGDWVAAKNDPAFTALFETHLRKFNTGQQVVPMENPQLDAMYNQFFAETNQELVDA
jgi:hypothetical protein